MRKTNRGAVALLELMGVRGSRAELADALKVDRSVLTRWLQGMPRPSAGPRLAIQERFGIDWKLWDEDVETDDVAEEEPSPDTERAPA
jgi:transcriptional regulator with XRE-family HTH domain